MKLNLGNKGSESNMISVSIQLLALLKIKCSKKYITDFHATHPNNETILFLTDLLRSLQIDSNTTLITAEQLSELPLPAIAHLQNDVTHPSHFVIISEVNGTEIIYLHPEAGWFTESLYSFCSRWNGVVLYVETNEASGEINYIENRRKEKIHAAGLFVKLAIPTLLLIFSLYMGSMELEGTGSIWALLLFLKIIGTAISCMIIGKEIGYTSNIIKTFCSLGGISNNVDCSSVYNTKSANLLGFIKLSELGLSYFFGGLLLLLISPLIHYENTIYSLLAFINIPAILFIPFSLYIQLAVVRKICPMCVSILVIFLIEGIIFLFNKSFRLHTLIDLKLIYAASFSYLTPLIIYLIIKPILEKGRLLTQHKKQLNFLKNSRNVANSILNECVDIPFNPLKSDIILGNKNGAVTIIVLLSPVCNHCMVTFPELLKISSRYHHIKFVIRIAPESDESSQLIAAQLLHFVISDKEATAIEALSYWYKSHMNYNKFKQKYIPPVSGTENEIPHLLLQLEKWRRIHSLNETPSYILNNKLLPGELQLRYFLPEIPFVD